PSHIPAATCPSQSSKRFEWTFQLRSRMNAGPGFTRGWQCSRRSGIESGGMRGDGLGHTVDVLPRKSWERDVVEVIFTISRPARIPESLVLNRDLNARYVTCSDTPNSMGFVTVKIDGIF